MDEIELYIEQVPIQPRVRGQLLGNFTHLLLRENDNVEEFEYGCGPSSALVVMNYECKEDEDEEECESQEDDDQSERTEDVQHDGHEVFEFMDEENNNVNVVSSFLTLTKQWKVNKGDMSQWVGKVVICQITQIPRAQWSLPLFSITWHHFCSLKM